jgi:7-cyano-7-deazaguanine synthase
LEFVALKALLFSGGLDSTCIAKLEQPDVLITIDYGQKQAAGEIAAAKRIAKALAIRHRVVVARPEGCGQGLMAGKRPSQRFPPEWWPFRNQYLLTVGAMLLESTDSSKLLIGTVVTDAKLSDGSPSFIDSFNELLRTQRSSVTVKAPAIKLTSQQLYRKADLDRAISGWVFSCHVDSKACGVCRGCQKSSELVSNYRRH